MLSKLIKTLRKNSADVHPEYLRDKYRKLMAKGSPGIYFFVMAITSAGITTMGFLMNSPSVIIGAMVISPLLYPVVLAGSALAQKEQSEFFYLIKLLGLGAIVVLVVSSVFSFLVPFAYQSELHSRLASSPLEYFVVAALSGVAGTFSYYWPRISETITGVGISVALMPPFVMVGVALSNTDWSLLSQSTLIVFLNVLGIMFGSALAFLAMRRYAVRTSG